MYIPAAAFFVPSKPAELCILARAPPATRVFVLSLLALLVQKYKRRRFLHSSAHASCHARICTQSTGFTSTKY